MPFSTADARKVFKRYGATNCLRAYIWNRRYGEGAASIALQMPLDDAEKPIRTTQQADAAIFAAQILTNDSTDTAQQMLKNAIQEQTK